MHCLVKLADRIGAFSKGPTNPGWEPSAASEGTKRCTVKGGVLLREGEVIHQPLYAKIFQDSYAMIPQPLSKLLTTFGFEDDVKGFFPHGYAWADRLYKKRKMLPKLAHYWPGKYKPAERTALIDWYNNERDKPFDFKDSAKVYGKQDVRILAKACLAFRNEIMGITGGVDPWLNAFTLANLCGKIYRGLMMQPKSIAIVPANGYGGRRKAFSLMALKYLHWVSKKRGIQIKTASDFGGEATIVGVGDVDGYCEETREVWEVAGCFFHGCQDVSCPKRTNENQIHPMHAPLTFGDVHDRSLDRVQSLKKLGYTVHLIWEHAVRRLVHMDKGLKEVWDDPDLWSWYNDDHCIDRREPLSGGQTEPIRALVELTEEQMEAGWSIEHYDITRYPTLAQFTHWDVRLLQPLFFLACTLMYNVPMNT